MSLSICFMQLVAVAFFFSFLSFYIQWPGLYGDYGLLPLYDYLKNIQGYFESQGIGMQGMLLHIPSAFIACDFLKTSTTATGDSLLLLGMLTSCLIVRGKVSRYVLPLLLTVNWMCYLSVITVGQTFATFQWDGLLLEVGFLSIFVALSEAINTGQRWFLYKNLPMFGVRFLAWKLMFSAGVVKLQANCPTWNALTALEYHFATQPLPTILGWWAHQLPPVLLRMGVAATLIIEIPATFMLLAPNLLCRRVGVIAQLLLQLMIMITGNYNFFNLLTMVLMVPSWMDDSQLHRDTYSATAFDTIADNNTKADGRGHIGITNAGERNTGDDKGTSCRAATPTTTFTSATSTSVAANNETSSLTVPAVDRFHDILWVVALLIGMTWWMLDIVVLPAATDTSTSWWDWFGVGLKVKWPELLPLMLGSCALATAYVVIQCVCETLLGVYISWQTLRRALNKPEQKQSVTPRMTTVAGAYAHWSVICVLNLMLCAFTLLWISVAAIPLNEFDSRIQNANPFQSTTAMVYQKVQPFRVVSGYGLFRVMTGVGEWSSSTGFNESKDSSWGSLGLPPTIVARPELIFEGLHPETGQWLEIPFMYKPTSTHQRPQYVIPHQPRLDWQLWFAALGSYNHNPWLVHLVYKLLTAEDSGKTLASSTGTNTNQCDAGHHQSCPNINSKSLINPLFSTTADVLKLLDRYAFRRLFNGSSPLEVRIIKYELDFTRLNTSWSRSIPGVDIISGSVGVGDQRDDTHAIDRDSAYWQRKNPSEYFPGIRKDNPSLLAFLRGNGIFVSESADQSVAMERDRRCYDGVDNDYDVEQVNGAITSVDIIFHYARHATRKLVCSSVAVRNVVELGLEHSLSLQIRLQEWFKVMLPHSVYKLLLYPYHAFDQERHANSYLNWDWICCGIWPILLLGGIVWSLDKLSQLLSFYY